jgi:hypothetical protein
LTTLRPIDELAEDAQISLRYNAGCVWLEDAAGVEYRPPAWLARALRMSERLGELHNQAVLREALGIKSTQDLVQLAGKALGGEPPSVRGELARIHDQLENGDAVIIEPGSVIAQRIGLALTTQNLAVMVVRPVDPPAPPQDAPTT